jgi:signal transduction histidine kinase
MTDPAVYFHRVPGAGVLDPFNIAGYVTWLLVVLATLWPYAMGPAEMDARVAVGIAALFVMLALFLLRAWGDAHGMSQRRRQLATLAQGAGVILAFWCIAHDLRSQIVVSLFCVVVAQMPRTFERHELLPAMLALHLPMVALLLRINDPGTALVIFLAELCLQLFIVMAVTFAVGLQESGQAMMRINKELLATRQLLEEGARADERLRLSRELHDIAGHKLTALKMQLTLHRRETWRRAPALDESLRLAEELLADIRGVVSTLRDAEGVDLPAALRALDPGLPRPKLSFEIEPGLRIADMRSADALLRCAQEALTNALRHSRAWIVRLRLGYEPAGLVLEVEDDGRGWGRAQSEGNGIRGMRERMAEVGGELELRQGRAGGAALRAILPGLTRPAALPAESTAPLFQPDHFCRVRKLLHADDRAGR